jgi:hypothetical protein
MAPYINVLAAHGKHFQPVYAETTSGRRLRASRRLAADMATAPGFAGLADIVDRLVASSNCDPFPVDAEKV